MKTKIAHRYGALDSLIEFADSLIDDLESARMDRGEGTPDEVLIRNSIAARRRKLKGLASASRAAQTKKK